VSEIYPHDDKKIDRNAMQELTTTKSIEEMRGECERWQYFINLITEKLEQRERGRYMKGKERET